MNRCNSISWWILKLIFSHYKIKSYLKIKIHNRNCITKKRKHKNDRDYEEIVGLVLISTWPSRLPKYALEIIFTNKPVSTTPIKYNKKNV